MKFRTKTVLGVTLIQAVLLSVLIVSLLAEMQAACRKQIQYRADVSAQMMVASARDAMVSDDVSTLAYLAHELVSSQRVSWVAYVDDDGHLLATEGPRPAQPSATAPREQDAQALVRSVDVVVSGQRYGRVEFAVPLAEMVAELTAARNNALMIGGLVMVCVAVFSGFLGQLLSRRLNDLSKASRDIEEGNLQVHVDEKGNDELAETAERFNHMARKLAEISAAHTQAVQDLSNLAYRDPLTDVHNRRSFMDVLAMEVNRVQRTHQPASLLMLDIDHFKRVNDTWGHSAGDEVLKHLVTVLQQKLRRIDTLGRLGGEEFAILLPGTDLQGATELSERLRSAVEHAPATVSGGLPGGAQSVSFTISIGVAVCGVGCTQSDDVLKWADRAMYQAKATGRNRVCAFDGPTPATPVASSSELPP